MTSHAYRKLEKWIDRPLERWNLLYRATRDGFSPAKFHELCDGKGETVSMARLKTDEAPGTMIMGGYARRPWSSPANARDVFDNATILFGNLPGDKYGRVARTDRKGYLCHRPDFGPAFGIGGRALTLLYRDEWCFTTVNDIEEGLGVHNFRAMEIEVFSLAG